MKTQKKTRRKKSGSFGSRSKNRKILYISLGILGGLVLIYLLLSVFFLTHFMPRTVVNGHPFGGLSASVVNKRLAEIASDYSLTVTSGSGETYHIEGTDIGLAYDPASKDAQKFLEQQNAFAWPVEIFSSNEIEETLTLSYDEAALEEKIMEIATVAPDQIEPKSAYPEYNGTEFVIIPAKYGIDVDTESLREKLRTAVLEMDTELDLKEEFRTTAPPFTEESQEVINACSSLNLCRQAEITYQMDVPVTITGSDILPWLSADENMNVVIDEPSVRAWLEAFGERYDTIGTTRTFTTPSGKSATVSGGTYGWSVNEDEMYTDIINTIKAGSKTTLEPHYYISGTAASHSMPDWGNTYIDVDLSVQHMWYVKDGNIVLETDVVTGEPIPEKITPEGVYSIQEKDRNTYLTGATDPATGQPSYRTLVNYWMRVTWEGVGFHDATWQSAFGGTRNQIPGVGSHGCINMPLDQAAKLYDLIDLKLPVVIHY